MAFLRKVEVACGIATVLLAFAITVIVFGPPYDLQSVLLELLGAAVFFIVPGLLTLLGSYLHAARGSNAGFVLLWVGGGLLTVMLLVHVFGGVFYVYGLWKGLVILTPSVAAILTLIASLLARRASKSQQNAR